MKSGVLRSRHHVDQLVGWFYIVRHTNTDCSLVGGGPAHPDLLTNQE
jgi:hypothetical protein